MLSTVVYPMDACRLHGECVSVGIVYELIATRALRLCDEGLPSRAEFCLQVTDLCLA